MNYQIKGVSPEMSNQILEYVNSRAKSQEERQAMIDDMLPEAIEYERQQKVKSERDILKNQLREKISKETRGQQANQLQFSLRSAILSDMVRDYAKKIGGSVNGLDNDEQLLNAFLAKNPSQAKVVERYLNGELSNLDIGKRLGFIQNGQTADIEQEIETPGFGRHAGQMGTDIVGGVLDSVVGIPKLLGKGLGNAVARTAKKFGADEQKVDALNQSWKEHLDKGSDIGQDTESATYGITNTVADLVQVATPGGVVKAGGKGIQIANTSGKLGVNLAKIFPKTANFINKTEKGADFVVGLLNKAGGKVDQLTQKAPLLGKMLKSGFDGASDMVLFNAVNGEGTDVSEMGIGAGFGAAFPILGKALGWAGKKVKNLIGNSASKLELNGILNPAKLETVQQQLITEGATLPGKATPQDVGKWMLERGFKGSKGDIVNQLTTHAKKSKKLVDELLSLSNSAHKVNEVNEALEMLAKDYSTTPGLTNKADEILGMIKEEYTLSEMNKVKRHLDDAYNMFNKNGTETAGLKAEGLRNIRSTIKKTIEEVAESEGLGNIRMLNNETQIARGLADGIGRKDKADIVRELLSPFSSARNGAILGGLGGGATPNDSLPERIGNIAKGAIIGGILGSTKAKTTLANMLKKLGGIEKKEITQWIASEGTSKLSQKSAEILEGLVKQVSEESILSNRKIYEGAKQELDSFLDQLAETNQGKVLKVSLKFLNSDGSIKASGIQRIIEKANKKSGNLHDVTDIVRGSVIVDSKDQIPVILKHIQGLPIKNFDDKFTNPTSLGYKDISFLYPTSQGVLAETQINIPGMIIAKEGKLAVEMGVVSQEAYDQMIKKAGVEGGLGHKYYEEWRSLEEMYKTASKQQQSIIEKKMKQIESESRDYYTKFE